MKVPIGSLAEIRKIRLKGAVAEYRRGVTALAVDELEFGRGVYVVVGPNGAGKTTLLYLVSGMMKPAAGKVIVNDMINIAELPARARAELRKHHYTILLQEDIFLEHLSVYENIALPFTIHGQPAPEERISELAEAFGIKSLLNRRPSELSGGERRKAGIVRALAKAPNSSVVILDEPTSNLDIESVRALTDIIDDVLRSKICLIATHDTDLASVGDAVVKLRAGKVVGRP